MKTGIVIGVLLQFAAIVAFWLMGLLLSWRGVLLFSLPLYLASIVAVMRSDASFPLRFCLSFWPVGLYLTVSVPAVLFGTGNIFIDWLQTKPEVILVPAGFRGNGKVIFDDPNGVLPEYRNGKVVYRIGANGEFRTRVRQRELKSDQFRDRRDDRREFYFVDAEGREVQLRHPGEKETWSPVHPPEDKKNEVIAIYVGVPGADPYQSLGFRVGTWAELYGPDGNLR